MTLISFAVLALLIGVESWYVFRDFQKVNSRINLLQLKIEKNFEFLQHDAHSLQQVIKNLVKTQAHVSMLEKTTKKKSGIYSFSHLIKHPRSFQHCEACGSLIRKPHNRAMVYKKENKISLRVYICHCKDCYDKLGLGEHFDE